MEDHMNIITELKEENEKLVKMYEDDHAYNCNIVNCLKEENKKLKGNLNSLTTDEQKDIILGEGLENPEDALYTGEDFINRIKAFLKERDELKDWNDKIADEFHELKEENGKLKDWNDKLECGKVVFECGDCEELKKDNEYLHMKCEIQETDLINYHDLVESINELIFKNVDETLGIKLDKSSEIKPLEIKQILDKYLAEQTSNDRGS